MHSENNGNGEDVDKTANTEEQRGIVMGLDHCRAISTVVTVPNRNHQLMLKFVGILK